MDRKRQQKEAEDAEKVRFSEQWATIQAQLEREESEQKEDRRRKNLEVQAALLRQAQEKEAALAAAKRRHREDEADAARKAQSGDTEFDALAEKCVAGPVHACVFLGKSCLACVFFRMLIFGALLFLGMCVAGLLTLKSGEATTLFLPHAPWSEPVWRSSFLPMPCSEACSHLHFHGTR